MDTTLGKIIPHRTDSGWLHARQHVAACLLTLVLTTPTLLLCLAFDVWIACQRFFPAGRGRRV